MDGFNDSWLSFWVVPYYINLKGDFEGCAVRRILKNMQSVNYSEIVLIHSVRNFKYFRKSWSFSNGLRMYQWLCHKIKILLPF